MSVVVNRAAALMIACVVNYNRAAVILHSCVESSLLLRLLAVCFESTFLFFCKALL